MTSPFQLFPLSNECVHSLFCVCSLQVLGETIDTKWKILPQEQREGIRNYVIGKIVALAVDDPTMKANSTFLAKLNLVLVQILKQDWPHNWPSFIGDIVGASKTSECLCENNMKILQLLSEEIFDFSSDSMTSAKIKHMKESLNEEFSQIFQLCEFILDASQKQSLLKTTFVTLQRFLSWIPMGYIFETKLLNTLITKFLPVAAFRVETLNCLIEVASLPVQEIRSDYHPIIKQMMIAFMAQLAIYIPKETVSLTKAYANGSSEECLFVQRLALFLGTFLRSHIQLFLEPRRVNSNQHPQLQHAHQGAIFSQGTEADGFVYDEIAVDALMYLVRISEVDDEEIFKTCLEYWHFFSKEIYNHECVLLKKQGNSRTNGISNDDDGVGSPIPDEDDDEDRPSGFNNKPMRSGSDLIYSSGSRSASGGNGLPQVRYNMVLLKLRHVIIDKMAKPEEVIIVEDDNGEIVREMTKDTEVIAQYKTMREVIIYLTNLNYEETELIMLEKLDAQVEGGMFTWNGLNTLCWAIGSISGAMSENDEKRFLVTVIKDLLRLCEEQRGKDNKAVVASNIMYIVGQYPRFLRAHWKFLKTVVNKLFEFMHELHKGVQDMACDTFLKIAQKCKRKFVTKQADEVQPFIMTLIASINRHTADLQPHQVQSFYESVGTMVSDTGYAVEIVREEAILALMESPNRSWSGIVNEVAATNQMDRLFSLEVTKELSRILKINTRVCVAAGSIYVHQLSKIFMDIMSIYRLYSEHIIQACQQQGEIATRLTQYKAMRVVKTDILELVTAFLEASHDLEGGANIICMTFLPSLKANILTDYKTSPPAARDAKVLKLFATAVSTLKDVLTPEIPVIMESIFEPTLELITKNMMDHPEHRTEFFHFLHVANEFCFYGLFSIPPHHQKLVIDSIVWAFKHTERNISEEGLEILLAVLKNIDNISGSSPQVAQSFYSSFLLNLITEIFNILTDRLHKSGFKVQTDVLHHIVTIIMQGKVQVPLFDANILSQLGLSASSDMNNITFIKPYITKMLVTAFPNLAHQQVMVFVDGLMDVRKDNNAFKTHMRDFLVTVKEFNAEGGDSNADLFIDEQEASIEAIRSQQQSYMGSVPGLLSQNETIMDDPDL